MICKRAIEWYPYADDVSPFTTGIIVVITSSIVPTVVLNALILTAIVRTPTLHTPSNILICNLAVANLGVGLLALPFGVAWKLLELYHQFDDIVCATSVATFMFGCIFNGASYLTILFAIVDRYLALVLHLRYLSLVTFRRIIKSCVIIWVISLGQMILFFEGSRELHNISVSIAMALLLIIMAICYSKIFTIIRRHHIQIAAHPRVNNNVHSHLTRYRKSVLNLFYVMLCQVIFMTPFIICLAILAARGVSVELLRFWSVSVALLFLNPLVNPLLLCKRYGDLRGAVQETAGYYWTRVKELV